MPNNKKRGDNVASSRSRLEKDKAVPKLVKDWRPSPARNGTRKTFHRKNKKTI